MHMYTHVYRRPTEIGQGFASGHHLERKRGEKTQRVKSIARAPLRKRKMRLSFSFDRRSARKHFAWEFRPDTGCSRRERDREEKTGREREEEERSKMRRLRTLWAVIELARGRDAVARLLIFRLTMSRRVSFSYFAQVLPHEARRDDRPCVRARARARRRRRGSEYTPPNEIAGSRRV